MSWVGRLVLGRLAPVRVQRFFRVRVVGNANGKASGSGLRHRWSDAELGLVSLGVCAGALAVAAAWLAALALGSLGSAAGSAVGVGVAAPMAAAGGEAARLGVERVAVLVQLGQDLHDASLAGHVGASSADGVAVAVGASLQSRAERARASLDGLLDALEGANGHGSFEDARARAAGVVDALRKGAAKDARKLLDAQKEVWRESTERYDATLAKVNGELLRVVRDLPQCQWRESAFGSQVLVEHWALHANGVRGDGDEVVHAPRVWAESAAERSLRLFFGKAGQVARAPELRAAAEACASAVNAVKDCALVPSPLQCADEAGPAETAGAGVAETAGAGEGTKARSLLVGAVGLAVDARDQDCVLVAVTRFLARAPEMQALEQAWRRGSRSTHDTLELLSALVVDEQAVPRAWLVPI